ncbi:MAG: TIGR02186 family protein [Desulfomonilaceae bacterium]
MRPHGDVRQRLAAVLALLLMLLVPSMVWGDAADLKISPDLVEIGTWFRGHQVTASAMIPKGAEAVIEIVGQSIDEPLMRKGRRAGLWMNVGEIEVRQAPSLYMAMSTNPELLQTAASEAPWGYASLRRRLTMSGMIDGQEKDEFFQQFLELKESEGLYASFKDPVKKSGAAGGLTPIKGEFRLPTNVKPGVYQVCLSVIKDGQVIAKNCRELQVKMVGFPAMFTTLAYEHGLTYGILAVVIAIITGFAMGFLFKGGGGH